MKSLHIKDAYCFKIVVIISLALSTVCSVSCNCYTKFDDQVYGFAGIQRKSSRIELGARATDYDGTMADEVEINLNSVSINTVGLSPSIDELTMWHRAGCIPVDILKVYLGAGPSHHYLYLVRKGDYLYFLLTVSNIPTVKDVFLSEDELLGAFFANRGYFQKVDPSIVYVEPWFYKDVVESGIILPSNYRPMTRHWVDEHHDLHEDEKSE